LPFYLHTKKSKAKVRDGFLCSPEKAFYILCAFNLLSIFFQNYDRQTLSLCYKTFLGLHKFVRTGFFSRICIQDEYFSDRIFFFLIHHFFYIYISVEDCWHFKIFKIKASWPPLLTLTTYSNYLLWLSTLTTYSYYLFRSKKWLLFKLVRLLERYSILLVSF
jgi:hypothetical protein